MKAKPFQGASPGTPGNEHLLAVIVRAYTCTDFKYADPINVTRAINIYIPYFMPAGIAEGLDLSTPTIARVERTQKPVETTVATASAHSGEAMQLG